MRSLLQERVAIVTGAGGETGSAIALTLAKAGARVVVNDINPDRAERTAAAIRRNGQEALAITADVANRFQCVHLIESTRETWGRIDILINNAAVRPIAPILTMDEWAWQRCFDVNLKGAFFMSQLVGRVMVDENKERGGTIITIGAALSDEVLGSGLAAYRASKAGLDAFARECAREYGQYGVRVVALQPAADQLGGEEEAKKGLSAEQAVAQSVLLCCLR